MSHNHTKSDNDRLYAALPIRRIDENHELLDEPNENFEEVPPNPEYTRATTAIGATVPSKSNADSNNSDIDPRTSLAAETQAATGLDYKHNPDFLLPSGETVAQGKRRDAIYTE